MKIGILGHGFIEWGGGIDFLRIIAGSLRAADPEVELHFLFPIKGPRYYSGNLIRRAQNVWRKLIGRTINVSSAPDRSHALELGRSISGKTEIHCIDIGNSSLFKMVRKLKLDVVLPAIYPLSGIGVPWIGYLFDYQHAHFPQFFSEQELADRRRNFDHMLRVAEHIMVNSRSVVQDIRIHSPAHRATITALPFSAAPHPDWLRSTAGVIEKYALDGPFFLISNQFWQHKDHLTAWKAFAQVLEKFPELNLVCTGQTHDYRNPGHYPGLLEAAAKLRITSRLKILGFIPKAEQIELMKKSIAVIQPTLFEGGPGGGAAYDAISLGLPIILSDIPVNRELNEPDISFFVAGDAQSLAERMISAIESGSKPEHYRPEELVALGERRRAYCGRVILETIQTARRAQCH